ncbi:MAG: hypothetical protein AAF626_02025 [Pseudomonadota bacterium]
MIGRLGKAHPIRGSAARERANVHLDAASAGNGARISGGKIVELGAAPVPRFIDKAQKLNRPEIPTQTISNLVANRIAPAVFGLVAHRFYPGGLRETALRIGAFGRGIGPHLAIQEDLSTINAVIAHFVEHRAIHAAFDIIHALFNARCHPIINLTGAFAFIDVDAQIVMPGEAELVVLSISSPAALSLIDQRKIHHVSGIILANPADEISIISARACEKRHRAEK